MHDQPTTPTGPGQVDNAARVPERLRRDLGIRPEPRCFEDHAPGEFCEFCPRGA